MMWKALAAEGLILPLMLCIYWQRMGALVDFSQMVCLS
jgi:hypothetical protein